MAFPRKVNASIRDAWMMLADRCDRFTDSARNKLERAIKLIANEDRPRMLAMVLVLSAVREGYHKPGMTIASQHGISLGCVLARTVGAAMREADDNERRRYKVPSRDYREADIWSPRLDVAIASVIKATGVYGQTIELDSWGDRFDIGAERGRQ